MISSDGDDRFPITEGVDTDRDGRPDTVLLPVRSDDLMMIVDVDRDGLADLLIRIGANGVAQTVDLTEDPTPWWPTDPAADACYDPFGQW